MKIFNLLFSLFFIPSYNYCYSQVGKIDSTFAINGFAYSFLWASNVTITTNDKILITESSGGNKSNFGLARFNANGIVDSAFGINGRATGTNDIDTKQGCDGIILQTDGKIVVSSSGFYNQHFILARYDSNGNLDQSFGVNGIVKTSWGNYIHHPSLAIQFDGKIIAGGYGSINNLTNDFVLIRYNLDGSIDHSFGVFGEVNTSFSRPVATLTSLVIQSDGKIIAIGYTDTIGTLHEKYAIARYNSDGSLDNSFGTGGKLEPFLTNYYQDGILSSVIVQPDNKILVSGNYFDPNFSYDSFGCIFRLNPNGSFDTTFAVNGLLLQDFDTVYNGSGNSYTDIVLQSDNKLIAVGYQHYNFNDSTDWAMSRYDSLGQIDTSFGSNGKVVFFPGGWWNLIALQSTGKIVGASGFVVRFLNDTFLGTLNFSNENNTILIYPNPIRSQATLQYTLTKDEQITIELFDMQGKLVQQFITNQTRTTGKHEEVLKLNELLPSGTYIINITNGKNSQGVKVVKE